MLALPYGAAETGRRVIGSWLLVNGGDAGEELGQMLRHADRADARAAAAVRNAESLVQIEVANIGADIARAAKADLRVHVRAIHVNLAAVVVHDLADFADGGFKNAVGRRIGHHQRRQILAVRVGLGPQIGQVDVAIFQATHRHDPEAGHDRAGGIGPVGGGGNEANIAMRFAARLVITADGEQAGVFALRAGVRLQ